MSTLLPVSPYKSVTWGLTGTRVDKGGHPYENAVKKPADDLPDPAP